MRVLILLCTCPLTAICILILVYVPPHTTIYVSSCMYLLPQTKRPTHAYVWHAWILREVGDVCAVVKLGKLYGKHLSMMLSLVSRGLA